MRYVGIDWASEIHFVALMAEDGTLLDEWELEHTRRAVDGLIARLSGEGGPASVRIGIESGAPLLVDQLAEAGYAVFLINPKQGDRFRDRHSPAGCKDDRRDARAWADAVRTDASWLTPLAPDSSATQELCRRGRARTRLVEHRVRTGLQLRDTLTRYFPALLALGRKMHDGFLLALLEAYPTPGRAGRATRPRLARLLRAHRIRCLTATELQALLKAPALAAPEAVELACRDEALDLAAQLRLLNTQIQRAEDRIDALFARHPDRDLVRGIPGIGERLAADILAELGDDPRRRTQPEVLTVYAGAAPVTRATGTRKKRRKNGQRASVHVTMRFACNRRLQRHLWLAARASVARSRWARAYVAHRRRQGHGYNAILRALSYKWGKILAHLLERQTPYDEDLHIEHLLRNHTPWARELDTRPDARDKAA